MSEIKCIIEKYVYSYDEDDMVEDKLGFFYYARFVFLILYIAHILYISLLKKLK